MFKFYSILRLKMFSGTEQGALSVARFCYVFPCELRGPAWAVGSGPPAGGTPQILVNKTSRMTGRLRVYVFCH